MDYKTFGLEIMVYRKRNGITQTEFAGQAEISRNYVSIIERGEATNLSVDILVRLALAMKENPCNLLNALLATRPGEVYRATHPERKGKDA